MCARAWFSEHQSGLAADLWQASTKEQFLSNSSYRKYFEWLSLNAHEYGFTNTYIKWLEVDWYDVEPWHWRYVWEDLATILKKQNMTIAEYFKKQ